MNNVICVLLLAIAVSVTRCSSKPVAQSKNTIIFADQDVIQDQNQQHKIVRRLAPFPQPHPQPKGGGNKDDKTNENSGHLSLKVESQQKFKVSTVTIVFTVLGIVIAFMIVFGAIYFYWR